MKSKRRIHFRRCHVCGEVSQRKGECVEHCEHCLKPMAPFFYFDEKKVRVYSEHRERPLNKKSEPMPLRGLTAFW